MERPTLLSVALLGILAVTQTALAGNIECTNPSSVPASTLITGNLDVPAGDTCNLIGVTLIGNVTVEGSLTALLGTVIGGNLQANAQGNQASSISITLSGVTLTGNVNINGNATVEASFSAVGTFIGGNFQSNQASSIMLVGSTVIGNLQANQTTSTIQQDNIVCASTIGGNVQIQQSGPLAPWLIEAVPGSLAPCGSTSNKVVGNIQFQNNAAQGNINGNTVGGNLQFQNNTAAVTLSGNMVGQSLQFQNNAAPGNVDSNTVGGNLQFDNNAGGDVSSNTILGNNLECQNNIPVPTHNQGSNTIPATGQNNGQCAAVF